MRIGPRLTKPDAPWLEYAQGDHVMLFSCRDGTSLEFGIWLRNVDARLNEGGPFTIYATREFFEVNSWYDPQRRQAAYDKPTFLVSYNDVLISFAPLRWCKNELGIFLENTGVACNHDSWITSRARETDGRAHVDDLRGTGGISD